jgi:hypothetical protein
VNGAAHHPMKQKLPTLFMDIDGVFLRRRSSGIFDGFEVAPNCLEFLEWATARFRCRWLSARFRVGWPDKSRRAFRLAGAPLHDPRWAVLDRIEPAAWRVRKIEVIDPRANFWWVDDDPTEQDRAWLVAHGRQDRLIVISSDRDPDALSEARLRLSFVVIR